MYVGVCIWVCSYVCMCVCIHISVYVWRSEDTFQELFFFLHNVGPGYQTQAIRIDSKCLYPLI